MPGAGQHHREALVNSAGGWVRGTDALPLMRLAFRFGVGSGLGDLTTASAPLWASFFICELILPRAWALGVVSLPAGHLSGSEKPGGVSGRQPPSCGW